jgi:hypothetical protein
MVLLAGGIAENLYTGRANHGGVRSDYGTVCDLANALGFDGLLLNAYLKWMAIRNKAMLQAPVPCRWNAVDNVAKALLAQQKITGDEVQQIIRVPTPTMPDRARVLHRDLLPSCG